MRFSLRTLVIVMLLGVGLALAEVGWWRWEAYRKAEIEKAKFDWSIIRPRGGVQVDPPDDEPQD